MSIVSTSFVLRLISRMADVKDQQVDHEVVWPNADCVDQSFGKTAIDNHDLRVAQINDWCEAECHWLQQDGWRHCELQLCCHHMFVFDF